MRGLVIQKLLPIITHLENIRFGIPKDRQGIRQDPVAYLQKGMRNIHMKWVSQELSVLPFDGLNSKHSLIIML